MALATPALHAQGEDTDADVTSASFTPPAYQRLFAHVVTRRTSGGAANAATISDSEGGTWSEVVGLGLGASASIYAQVFTKLAVASPVAITVTAASTSATGMAITVISINGASTDLSNFKAASNANGDPAPTLDNTPASTSTNIVFFGGYGTAATAAPTNYTVIVSDTVPTLIRYRLDYDAGSPAAAVSWTTTNTNSIGIVLEVKAQDDTTGTGAGTLAQLAGAATGAEVFTGTGAGSIQALVGAATAVHGVAGTAAGLIAALTGAASGAHGVAGTGAGLIAALIGAATGTAGDGDTGYLPVHRPLIANPGSLLRRC